MTWKYQMYEGFKLALISHYIRLSDVISMLFINALFPYTYCIFFSLALQPSWALASAFIFILLRTVGLLGRVISSSQVCYINTYTHQTSMPCVGFELSIPASERAKTVHA
jgi:hypothetical protein